jgi:hypothetical protein
MGLKGKLKIILTGVLLGLLTSSKAQQERISLPEKFSLADSVKLPRAIKNSLGIGFSQTLVHAVESSGWRIQSAASLGNRSDFFPGLTGSPIAPDFITRQWGIFCQGEWKLEKKTGIPLRVRLGSLEYVNRLEGK